MVPGLAGLEFLLQAFCKSGLSGSNAVLLLVGDGPAAGGLRDYVNRMRLTDSVIFTGPVAHEDIPSYVDLFDIAVQPAANEYCCPMKILEYMGLAKAIIAPAQENIEELLEGGMNAVLFRPGQVESLASALAMLAADPVLRSQIGKRALQTIYERGLLWESNAQKVVEMLQAEPSLVAYE